MCKALKVQKPVVHFIEGLGEAFYGLGVDGHLTEFVVAVFMANDFKFLAEEVLRVHAKKR